MSRRKNIDDRQLSLFSEHSHYVSDRDPPEVHVLNWLSEENQPLIHVSGQNLCAVSTFRSFDRERWVERSWMDVELKRFGYRMTHTITHRDNRVKNRKVDRIWEVYRPKGK